MTLREKLEERRQSEVRVLKYVLLTLAVFAALFFSTGL